MLDGLQNLSYYMVKPQAQTLVRFTNTMRRHLKALGRPGPIRIVSLDPDWFRQHYDAKVEWMSPGPEGSGLYIVFSDARRATEFVLKYG